MVNDSAYYAGLDIGGTTVKAVLVNTSPNKSALSLKSAALGE